MHNSKKLWKTLKKVIPSKKAQSVPTIVNASNNKISTTKETANSFNNFFTSVGEELSKQFDNIAQQSTPFELIRSSESGYG